MKENGGPSVGTPFGTIRVLVLDIELFLKAIHTPACIYQLLLAGKEGMAVAANFNTNILFGGACFNLRAAGTLDCGPLIVGMNALFHYFSPRISLLQAFIIIPQYSAFCKRFFPFRCKNKRLRLGGDNKRNRFSAVSFGFWRRHPESNWGIKVLQTSALPLGYGAMAHIP